MSPSLQKKLSLDTPEKMWAFTVFKVSRSLFLDGALFRGVGASANASRKGIKPNARFVANPRTGSARLETSRPIQAGGEIFVSYGPDYWRGAHSSSHSTSLVPVWEWDLSDPFAQLLVARVLSPGPLVGSVHADLCPGSVPAGGFGWDFVEPHSVNSSDPPLLGRSFSLSVPSRRVGEFLGSLLRVALGLPSSYHCYDGVYGFCGVLLAPG